MSSSGDTVTALHEDTGCTRATQSSELSGVLGRDRAQVIPPWKEIRRSDIQEPEFGGIYTEVEGGSCHLVDMAGKEEEPKVLYRIPS